ncbi:hypothetical protein ACROYT_G037151 [Oculina patagonica]
MFGSIQRSPTNVSFATKSSGGVIALLTMNAIQFKKALSNPYTDEKPYQCDHCDLKCRLKSTLRRHWQRIHSGNKPYKCKECPKEFATQTDLIKHIRTHTEQTQYIYSCKQCNRAFTAKNSLRVHMLIHTGEKPFSCDMCGMSFRYKRTLKNHYAIHTDEKPTTLSTQEKNLSPVHIVDADITNAVMSHYTSRKIGAVKHQTDNRRKRSQGRERTKQDENKDKTEQSDVELVTEAIVECGDDVTASLSLI